ncbi:hypothetical protein K438DRAFT_1808303 [Mycena galopus ATCC 62051]|nr:hypothetical protein K438DRAFT_1808303 [Mycena galopus ATCC 62051]
MNIGVIALSLGEAVSARALLSILSLRKAPVCHDSVPTFTPAPMPCLWLRPEIGWLHRSTKAVAEADHVKTHPHTNTEISAGGAIYLDCMHKEIRSSNGFLTGKVSSLRTHIAQ